MMKPTKHRIMHSNTIRAFLIVLLLLPGCSVFNETRFEKSLGRDVNLINYSYDIADDLLSSSFPPLVPRQRDMTILTTTFVDANNLPQTSHFGRILQDNIGSRFVQRGYSVKEIRLRKELLIQEGSGETMLSRNLSLLEQHQQAQVVLVGTVSHVQRTMYITARLVNPRDNSIVASRSYRLFMDRNVLAMFNLRAGSESNEMIKAPSEPLMNSVLY